MYLSPSLLRVFLKYFVTFDRSGLVNGTFFFWSRNLLFFKAFAACIFLQFTNSVEWQKILPFITN